MHSGEVSITDRYINILADSTSPSYGTAIRARAVGTGKEVWIVELGGLGRFAVPIEFVAKKPEGSVYIPMTTSDLDRFRIEAGHASQDEVVKRTACDRSSATSEESVIPLASEKLRVGVRQVESGRVVIHKTVAQHEQIVDEPLRVEQFEVRRVPVNRYVDAPPSVRQQGDVTIVPLLEEVAVVRKRLILREELRIIRHQHERHQPQVVTLRREQVRVERAPPHGQASPDAREDAPSHHQT